jgi:hypothetical protein
LHIKQLVKHYSRMQNPTNDIENKIENREQQSLLCLVLLQALLSLCLVAYAEVLGDRLRPGWDFKVSSRSFKASLRFFESILREIVAFY